MSSQGTYSSSTWPVSTSSSCDSHYATPVLTGVLGYRRGPPNVLWSLPPDVLPRKHEFLVPPPISLTIARWASVTRSRHPSFTHTSLYSFRLPTVYG